MTTFICPNCGHVEEYSDYLPDTGNLMGILEAVSNQRDQAADEFVIEKDGTIRNLWYFKQGVKWTIEAITNALNHLPGAGNKVEPTGDSGELAAKILNETIANKPFTYSLIIEAMHRYGREAFEAGWKACESHFDPFSEIGGAPLQLEADYKEWKTKNQTK